MRDRDTLFSKAKALFRRRGGGQEDPVDIALPHSWFDADQRPSPTESRAPLLDVSDFMKQQGLSALVDKTRFRFPRQREQRDLMPPPQSFSTLDARGRITPQAERVADGSRRAMENQFLLLQKTFAGRPEILLWHALAISYLRRETPHTAKARALFFKIWDEQAEWMASTLNGRWLISALQTFADHGRTPAEVRCGAVGYVYGSFVKIYECEIASAYDRKEAPARFRGGAIPGLFEFQPGDDILFNLNTFAISQGLDAGPAGYALAGLVSQVKTSESLFRRVDDLAAGRPEAFFSFSGKGKGTE